MGIPLILTLHPNELTIELIQLFHLFNYISLIQLQYIQKKTTILCACVSDDCTEWSDRSILKNIDLPCAHYAGDVTIIQLIVYSKLIGPLYCI